MLGSNSFCMAKCMNPVLLFDGISPLQAQDNNSSTRAVDRSSMDGSKDRRKEVAVFPLIPTDSEI